MNEKLQNFIKALSLREKVLLSFVLMLCALFLGLKSGEYVSILYYKPELLEQFSSQQEQISKLSSLALEQNKNLYQIQEELEALKTDYKSHLDKIYTLAQNEKIIFSNIKNTKDEKEYFSHYELYLEFQTGFFQTMAFLQGLEQARIHFKNIKLEKIENKNMLKVLLELSFVVLKDFQE